MEQTSAPAPQAPATETPVTDKGLAPETNPAQGATPGGPTAGATAEAAKEAMRKYKLKVDGEEVEVDEDELKRGYTHQRAAAKRMQEGMKAKKQAEEFISMMKDEAKLMDAVRKLGHDPRALAEKYLAAQLEEEMLDPKEKELRDTRNRLKSFEEREKQRKEAEEAKVHEAMKAKYSQEYSDQFVDALKTSGLPPTKEMVGRMASYIATAAKHKFQMSASEAAQLVKQDQEQIYQRLYAQADPETLVKLLGEEGLQKIRTYDTSRLKDPAANLKTPLEQGEVTRKRDNTKRMSAVEWRAFNRGK